MAHEWKHLPDLHRKSVHHDTLVNFSDLKRKSVHLDTWVNIFQISKESQCIMTHEWTFSRSQTKSVRHDRLVIFFRSQAESEHDDTVVSIFQLSKEDECIMADWVNCFQVSREASATSHMSEFFSLQEKVSALRGTKKSQCIRTFFRFQKKISATWHISEPLPDLGRKPLHHDTLVNFFQMSGEVSAT